ncbi:MAG: SDR family NAD(P)-dependent oxidoreductase [Gemmatimonadetes bacterium]|nr:MAG: SDR family NAD(P)-dependent oxidoreductase [Gemmatimonadota bacterium]
MNRLQGKRALITGASAGIGRACARAFASYGTHLVLLARRRERLEALAAELTDAHGIEVEIHEHDVRDRAAAFRLADDLAAHGCLPDILVNNAGKARGLEPLQGGDVDDWEEMIDTNVKGLLYMTRAFLPHMVERGHGHVVNIGSIAGRQTYPRGNVYNATKFAVRALNEAMNLDVLGTKVRVSSVDPGLVETEFSEVRFHGDRERARTVYQGYTPLTPEDVADAVCYVANAPEHVNILELLILPTDQRNAYLVHKEPVEG